MYDFGKSFYVNLEELKSKNEAIVLGSKFRFTILTERLIRLEYSETSVFNDLKTELVSFRNFDVPKFKKIEDDKFLEIETDYYKLSYTKNEPFKGTAFSASKNLKIEIKNSEAIWYYDNPEAKNYYGSNISSEVKEKEKKENRGLFSLDGMVSFDDSDSLRIAESGSIEQPIKGNKDIYVFIYNKDFGLCVQDYFKLTGLPALIPKYALGNWWCRDLPYKTDELAYLVYEFEKRQIPLSVILLDKDWHIRDEQKKSLSGYTFNKNLIPDPKLLIDTFHQRGIHLGVRIDPDEGFYPYEEHYEELKSFLEYTGEGVISLDPLNPKMLDALLKFGIGPLENYGIDFIWNNSKDIKNLHKLWVYNYYLFTYLNRNLNKRGMILSRNSLKSSHRFPVLYAGNSKVSWENFKSTPFFNLSASNIGACWWSHDIGGFDEGIEDPELYIRSVQLGVFSPIMRFHSAGGKYYKREPWKWDIRTETIVTKYLRLRHNLSLYLYTEAYKYHKTGSMIFQPLYYYLPQVYDNDTYKIEYFFGSELLVSPIVNKKNVIMNRTIHKFYLPEGVWYEFTTGKRYQGNKKYTSFYKEEDYPIFAKKGSIIPLAIKSNINNTSNPTDIEIHVFPGQNNTYRMYEDDGESNRYQLGDYIITEIDYNYLQNNYTLIIRPIEGKAGIIPKTRNYKIRFRNTKFAETVLVYQDSTPIEIANKYVDNNDFIVEINNVSTMGQLTINCKGNDIEIDAVHVLNEDIDDILSDLQIETTLKEKIATILFSDAGYKQKSLEIRKLKRQNLDKSFINLFKKLLEYVEEL